jgi:hypothetical protein
MSGPKHYEGRRVDGRCSVTVNGAPLDARFDLRRFADGFEWGYDGNGPRQLALALLADHTGNDKTALGQCVHLTQALIETFEGEAWSITGDDIDRSLAGFTQVPVDLAGLLARVRGEE